MDATEKSRAPEYQRNQRMITLILFLVSFAVSTVAFITLDYLFSTSYSNDMLRWQVSHGSCIASDPVRYKAFKPNCRCTMNWGSSPYELFTNNLGLRDERIREVPLADARPRLLVLGSSVTQSVTSWHDSYVGKMAAQLPQYDFLNGGLMGYSASNHLNVARMVLAKGVDIDEVIVFIGAHEVHDEASFWQDANASGAVTVIKHKWDFSGTPWPARKHLPRHLLLTYSILDFFERFLVLHGDYRVAMTHPELPPVFDLEPSAWTYRKVNETDTPGGYAPLGVEGGIAKAKTKMTLLWQELEERNIAMSVVVYPGPAQLVHDTVDSRQVQIWREWCRGKCKRFISVFPAFFAAKQACPSLQPGCWYLHLFIFGDLHYNAVGNALVADAVVKSLKEKPPAKRPLSGSIASSAVGPSMPNFGVASHAH